ncbi:uncharacterized protein LOC132800639 [Ziziphus jujuba]|uniref:Uncharacterized protein LOC132800639 n=1 Tax=Ziziphus jujuba TaxID=326968 RepID=A0ABM4A260_ZIZJJ|nr:uncharacterized protein LOC132800639 [Ziziphus jujuba]
MSENARNAMIEKCLLGSSHQLWRNRVKELGQWVRKEFSMFVGIAGISSCVDITAFGLGWFAVGLKRRRSFSPFSIYEAIGVVLLNSLIPDRSQIFYVAGFTVSKIVSKADKASNSSVCAKVRRQGNKSSQKNSVSYSLCVLCFALFACSCFSLSNL